MKKVTHKFWDGGDGYCALGLFLHLSGATDKELLELNLYLVNDFRRDLGQKTLTITDKHLIMDANDMGDSKELNELLEQHNFPFELDENNQWVIYEREFQTTIS